MIRPTCGLAIFAAALTPAGLVVAQPVAVPTEWRVSSGPERCSVSGQPGEAFVFLAVNPEGGTMLRIHHPAIGLAVGEAGEAVITIGLERLSLTARGARTSDGTPGFTAAAPAAVRSALAAGGEAEVAAGPDAPILIDLAGLPAALEQLEACAAALTPRDAASIAVVKPKPVKFPAISPSDLPTAGATARQVAFRLTISPEGRTAACEIVTSSGAPALDARVCALLEKQSRFEPGRNAAGEAITATYQSRLTF